MIINSTTSGDRDLVWEKDDKGNDIVTMYQVPKKMEKSLRSLNL